MASVISNSTDTHFNIRQWGRCSSAYIHITNEDGSEIERQVLDRLRILMNGIERFNVSGYQSRHLMPSFLPYPTRDNSESQNLYYISYYSDTYGEIPSDIIRRENGLNHNRIDSEQFIFSYNFFT
jgi:hypothetical protein